MRRRRARKRGEVIVPMPSTFSRTVLCCQPSSPSIVGSPVKTSTIITLTKLCWSHGTRVRDRTEGAKKLFQEAHQPAAVPLRQV